ncbi:hemerythrin-like protein [Caenispirillum salinarum AK4]|uniref:Hemerythrin-like protein n=2 Tax=Caenispirillum TaxID=414051 RepID=K9GRC9_9PROT|nr:hemerythrin-like protein [Caenispirillum salinarum AK4]
MGFVGDFMAFLDFSEQLKVGFALIDDDHKILIDQINMLADSLADGDDQDAIGSVLNVLVDYTEFHFGREQQLMEQTGYEQSPGHLREHAVLVKQVSEMSRRYQAGEATAKDLMNFLKVWITQHILKSDKALAQHLLAHNGSTELVQQASGQGEIQWSKLSVLIVDDQFNFRSLLRSLLNTLGVTHIHEAKSGHEALDMMANFPVDVVLVDDGMKPMDGISFTKAVRSGKHGVNPKTLVILMPSNEITKDYLLRATQSGVHDLVVKPLAAKTVRGRIERHLRQPLPFRQMGDMLIPVRQPPAKPHAARV